MRKRGRKVTVEAHLVCFVEEVQQHRHLGNFNRALNFILAESVRHKEQLLSSSDEPESPTVDANMKSPSVPAADNSFLANALDALG